MSGLRLMTGACCAAVLAGCILTACEAKRPPVEDVVDAKPLKEEALPGQPAPTNFRRSVADLKAAEPDALKAAHGVAAREGKYLKAYVGGKLVFNGADMDCTKVEAEECEAYVFAGSLRLASPQGGKFETYPLIQHSFIESAIFHIPLAPGKTFDINAHALASPDGRLIAAGSESVDEMNGDSVLTLYDWAGQKTLASFDASCQPNAWLDNSQLTVLCMIHSDGIVVFEGLVSRNLTGNWTLKSTRRLDPATYIPLAPDKQVLATYTAHTAANTQAAAD